MEKDLVNEEQASKLKALGFKERTWFAYNGVGHTATYSNLNGWDFNNSFEGWVSRPTRSQVFRWFRENHRLSQNTCDWLDDFEFIIFEWTLAEDRLVHTFPAGYDTHEEAESECINELIKMVS